MWICTGWFVPHAAQIIALSLDSSFERQCKSEKDMECSDLEPASERACRIADSIMTNTRMYLSRKTRQCNTAIAQSALRAVAAALVLFASTAGAGWGQQATADPEQRALASRHQGSRHQGPAGECRGSPGCACTEPPQSWLLQHRRSGLRGDSAALKSAPASPKASSCS